MAAEFSIPPENVGPLSVDLEFARLHGAIDAIEEETPACGKRMRQIVYNIQAAWAVEAPQKLRVVK